VLYLFALYVAHSHRQLDKNQMKQHIQQLLELPGKTERVLESSGQCESLAGEFYKVEDFLFLGRAVHYPIAMDGALKLKEVSYVHAEGYPTGETKHGPTALIDETLPIVIIATCDRADAGSVLRYKKSVANIAAFKKQGARIIALVTGGDQEASRLADYAIEMPSASELLSPILEIVPLQLFAYYMAVSRGLDVDRPRNLTKSVTVE
jgi:glucosamine--fructose-6-phosphate aminotransferase (isomerizing)